MEKVKKLEEVCDILIGGTPSRSISSYWKDGTSPWVSIADMTREGKYITNTKEKITEKGIKNSNVKLIPKDSLLFSFKLSIGKLAFAGEDLYTNEAIAGFIIKDKNELDKNFLYYFLKSSTFDTAQRAVKGNTLNKEKMKVLEIPIPPIETQKKIVKILDEKFEKLNKAKKIREDNILNAEKILSKTLDEIFKEGKIKKWEEKNINELVTEIKSGFACGQQNKVNNGVVHLRTHNISLSGELNLDKIIKIPKSFVDENIFNLKKDDIIFNNTNSKELVGKTILIHEDLPYAFSNHLTRIRFNKNIILPSWVLYVFQKYWTDKVFEKMCTRWIGQAGINQTSLGNLKIMVPPIDEQQQIISKIDKLSGKLRRLKELQNSQLEDFDKLEKAYLKEAFNDELI